MKGAFEFKHSASARLRGFIADLIGGICLFIIFYGFFLFAWVLS